MFRWSEKSQKRKEGIWPYLNECSNIFIGQTIYDATIPWLGGVRTEKEQNDCYIRGASKCDGIKLLSMHQINASNTGFGMALDIIPVGKNPYNDFKKLNYFGNLMMQCWQNLIYKYAMHDIDIGIMVWGGTFGSTSWDRAHYHIITQN